MRPLVWMFRGVASPAHRRAPWSVRAFLALAMSASSLAAAGVTTRVSLGPNGRQANGWSRSASVSDDGRYVAFASFARNLVVGDTNECLDVFLRDRVTGTTTRVSVASDGAQADNPCDRPSLSADGRYVAFESWAPNLVADDFGSYTDIFVHDRLTSRTERVSVSSDGDEANADCHEATISADGQCVAFSSAASALTPGDTNECEDIFVHDRATGKTERVSVASNGAEANGGSLGVSISADGRYVAFVSWASDLVPGDTNGIADVFVHDRTTDRTERVSVSDAGAEATGGSESASISRDGRYVAFDSEAANLLPDDTNDCRDVFVRDRVAGTTQRVSVAADGTEGDSASFGPVISAHGRTVAFSSSAGNLDADGTGTHFFDVFVHDLVTGVTERLTAGGGPPKDVMFYNSYADAISGDGRYVALSSGTANLVAGDTNGLMDVFLHDRGAEHGGVQLWWQGPRDLYAGQRALCTLTCYNSSLSPVSSVELGLDLPEGFVVEGIEVGPITAQAPRPAQAGATYVPVVQLEVLAPQTAAWAKFQLVPPAEVKPGPTTLTPRLEYRDAQGQHIQETQPLRAQLYERAILLSVQKAGPDQARRQSEIIYYVTLWNLATDLSELAAAYGQDVAASLIVMEDRLPREVTFVRAEPDGIAEYDAFDHTISFYLRKLADLAGKQLTISVVTQLRPDVPVGAIVEQMVNLPPLPDPPAQDGYRMPVRYVRSTSKVRTRVVGAIDPNHLSVEPEGPVPPTTRLSHTIEYENVGNIAAEYVRVETVLDGALDELSLEALDPQPAYDPATRRLIWEFHDAGLEPRESRWLHFSAMVRPDVVDGTQVRAQARVWFDQEEPLDTNDVVTEVRRARACDFDGDGDVDLDDLTAFLRFAAGHKGPGAYEEAYDVAPHEVTQMGQIPLHDGLVDHRDAQAVLEAVLGAGD